MRRLTSYKEVLNPEVLLEACHMSVGESADSDIPGARAFLASFEF